MSSLTQKYLKSFKKLEKKLQDISGSSDKTAFKDIIEKAKNKSPLIQHKVGIIWDLYALRNIFAHTDREKYIAEVNKLAFNNINKLLDLLDNPPTVGDVFKTDVFIASVDDITEIILRKMQEKLYTHVPVYDRDKFIGVLSETTVLNWLVENIKLGKAQFYKMLVKNINPRYLNPTNNLYKFVPPSFNIFEALKLFEEAVYKRNRLGAIFITSTGKKDKKPIGIITAWDLPTINKQS